MKWKIIFLLAFFFLISGVFADVCGNDACESGENMCSCPSDCGRCEGDVLGEPCHQFSCVAGSCEIIVVNNCCGNESCESGESYGNCPADCFPTEVSVSIATPDLSQTFYRSEEFVLKVSVFSHGRIAITADVNASSDFFPNTKLYNDSQHFDDQWFDEFYANKFNVPVDLNGLQKIYVDVNFKSVTQSFEYILNVDPVISLDYVLQDNYFLGDIIDLEIIPRRKGKRVEIPLSAKIFDGQNSLVFEENLNYADGKSIISYHTSLLDSLGTWKILLDGCDEFSNCAVAEKEFNMLDPSKSYRLEIMASKGFESSYLKGETVDFEFLVSDFEGKPAEGARVEIVSPANEIIVLDDNGGGIYVSSFKIPYSVCSGAKTFPVNAFKTTDNVNFVGTYEFDVAIQSVDLALEPIFPKEEFFRIGETMVIEFKLSYPDGTKVNNAIIDLVFNDVRIFFNEVELGKYRAEFELTPEMFGKNYLMIAISDEYDNATNHFVSFEVSGRDVFFEISQNISSIALAGFLALVIGYFVMRFYYSEKSFKSLIEEKERIISVEKELQEAYFKKNILSKKDYYNEFEGLEERLERVEKKLERFRK